MNALQPIKDAAPDLSIIVPIYNEEDSIDPLVVRLYEVLEKLPQSFEIIAVNDGKTNREAPAGPGFTPYASSTCLNSCAEPHSWPAGR